MKMGIKKQLLAICLVMATVSVSQFTFSNISVSTLTKSVSQLIQRDMSSLNMLNDMYLSYREIRINLRSLGLPELTDEIAKNHLERTVAAIQKFEELDASYSKLEAYEGQKNLHSKLQLAWGEFKAVGGLALKLYGENNDSAREKLVQVFHIDCPRAAKNLDEALNQLKVFHETQAKLHSDSTLNSSLLINRWMILITCMGLSVGLIFGYLISMKIIRSLQKISAELAEDSLKVGDIVQKLNSASQSLSTASTEQAAALQETASAVEEINSMVHKSSDAAKDSSSASDSSKSKAEHGQEVIQQMVASMGEINSSNDTIMKEITSSNQRISEIVQLIQEIGSKTKVINDIVFQTKLLSFNASVEAARAGEHGKGFAVVAEEVGNLAQMSGNAAKEISTMLDDSVKKVEVIVNDTKHKVDFLMNDAKTTVERGTQIAQECGEVLNDIVGTAAKVSQMVSSIADASLEQSRGVNEISKAIHELNQSTQMNASAANQCAGSAEQLSIQAQSLKHSAEELRVIVTGGTMSATTADSNREPPATHKPQTKKVPKTNAHREARLSVIHSPKQSRGSDQLPDPSEFDEVG